jgi:hypothetical protein
VQALRTQGLPHQEQGLRGLWLWSHGEDQEAGQQQEAPATQQKNPLGFAFSLIISFYHQVFNRAFAFVSLRAGVPEVGQRGET